MQKKTIAILQSNYIPWIGYFDLINRVDEFVIYDEVQYTKNDWRNRNLIKTINGSQWLTIPIKHKNLDQKIYETEVADKNWSKKHWNSIKANYAKAFFFNPLKDELENLYDQASKLHLLSEINQLFINWIKNFLEIDTKLIDSRTLNLSGDKNERLIEACKKMHATNYLSGPSAKAYLDKDLFLKNNIQVEWIEYKNYPEYQQFHGEFTHKVSVLDGIFHLGRSFSKNL